MLPSDSAASAAIPVGPPSATLAASKWLVEPDGLVVESIARRVTQIWPPDPAQIASRTFCCSGEIGLFFVSPWLLSTPITSLPNSASAVTWPWYLSPAAQGAEPSHCSPLLRPMTIDSGPKEGLPGSGLALLGLTSSVATVPSPWGLLP